MDVSYSCLDAIFDTLDKFIGGEKLEDDITTVVIKMQNWPSQLEKSDKLIKIIIMIHVYIKTTNFCNRTQVPCQHKNYGSSNLYKQ